MPASFYQRLSAQLMAVRTDGLKKKGLSPPRNLRILRWLMAASGEGGITCGFADIAAPGGVI